MDIKFEHAENLQTEAGPRAALPFLFSGGVPRSLLDVGCGAGFWLKVALDSGVREVFGVDGVDIPAGELAFPRACFRQQDLTVTWNLDRRFDAALCLEVAEHLSAAHARLLVKTLTVHSDLVFFSAACPDQPGQQHINCQWPEYWQELFNSHGFACSDQIRWDIWNDERVEPWYRQNLFVARRNPALAGKEPRLRPVIHPEMLSYMRDSFSQRQIETGELTVGWYLTLPFKAAASKLGRRFKSISHTNGLVK